MNKETVKVAREIASVVIIIAAMVGLYYGVEYSGWVLLVGALNLVLS